MTFAMRKVKNKNTLLPLYFLTFKRNEMTAIDICEEMANLPDLRL